MNQAHELKAPDVTKSFCSARLIANFGKPIVMNDDNKGDGNKQKKTWSDTDKESRKLSS